MERDIVSIVKIKIKNLCSKIYTNNNYSDILSILNYVFYTYLSSICSSQIYHNVNLF